MTRIQQVLFEFDGQYLGHPYFVTGNALFNAVARRVDAETRRSLRVSHGVFVPGEYGEYPAGASQDGYAGKLGQSLPDVEVYEDLFVFRDAAQRWLLDSRPRDAHNVHDLQLHGGRVAFDDTCWFGRPAGQRNRRRSVSWYLHCYLHSRQGDGSVVPVDEDVLDGLQVGGARNYGFGEVSVVDTQIVDLDALDFSRLKAAQASGESCRIELVSPFVLESEHPSGDAQDVPWWWRVDTDELSPVSQGGLRRRATRLVDGDETYAVTTVDHGQVVQYAGDEPVETARNGVLRVGTHSRFGFGEFCVRPASEDRVSERRAAGAGGEV
ncbi:hypothetical protein M0R89_15495 [Halorussus limi]|uniref:Uncharacterized protein n=2 Tax=Halorussus TaxID=1070314 RepID=A0A8U0IGZ4_9EURY|nr:MULTISPECIES: hypothetical protein [Halorussus]UPV73931.1 hypothetical protein M0R89_15495 [Halorussus limi]UPV99950.1 hypothetical protein M0R88_15715 [Halorussus gelatinilyticus]